MFFCAHLCWYLHPRAMFPIPPPTPPLSWRVCMLAFFFLEWFSFTIICIYGLYCPLYQYGYYLWFNTVRFQYALEDAARKRFHNIFHHFPGRILPYIYQFLIQFYGYYSGLLSFIGNTLCTFFLIHINLSCMSYYIKMCVYIS